MILTGENRSAGRNKTIAVPICLPKIPHGLSWDRIRPSAVTDQRVITRERERDREREAPPKGGGGEEKDHLLIRRFPVFALSTVW
jgi:hypothetical protein